MTYGCRADATSTKKLTRRSWHGFAERTRLNMGSVIAAINGVKVPGAAGLPAVIDANVVKAEVGERGGLAFDYPGLGGDGVDGGPDRTVRNVAVEGLRPEGVTDISGRWVGWLGRQSEVRCRSISR